MNTFRDLLESGKTYSMDEQKIKEAMASSGKTKVTDLMNYMKARYAGQYDLKLAKECAKEIVSSINESKETVFLFKKSKDREEVTDELSYEENLTDFECSIINNHQALSTEDVKIIKFVKEYCEKNKISYTLSSINK